jgi:hypothetical protein
LHVDSWVQGLNTVKRPKNNNNTKKKTAPTTDAGPQPCKAESNKRKQQAPNQRESTNKPNCSPRAPKHKLEPNKQLATNEPTNQRTNEQATTTEPVNNICISNDYETAAKAQKEPETYDEHASRNKQTLLLANCKH